MAESPEPELDMIAVGAHPDDIEIACGGTVARLARRGYEYDCSTLPTFLGPLARMYYFATARLEREDRAERKRLFGKWSEGLRPLQPYWWQWEKDASSE